MIILQVERREVLKEPMVINYQHQILAKYLTPTIKEDLKKNVKNLQYYQSIPLPHEELFYVLCLLAHYLMNIESKFNTCHFGKNNTRFSHHFHKLLRNNRQVSFEEVIFSYEWREEQGKYLFACVFPFTRCQPDGIIPPQTIDVDSVSILEVKDSLIKNKAETLKLWKATYGDDLIAVRNLISLSGLNS
jgi:hypothetical protein